MILVSESISKTGPTEVWKVDHYNYTRMIRTVYDMTKHRAYEFHKKVPVWYLGETQLNYRNRQHMEKRRELAIRGMKARKIIQIIDEGYNNNDNTVSVSVM